MQEMKPTFNALGDENEAQERPHCFRAGWFKRLEWCLRATQFSGCFSIFFMPTYLPRYFGQEKRISILKLCLCFVGLPAENEKFRLAVVFRQADVGLSELWQLRQCLDHPCFSSDVLDLGENISEWQNEDLKMFHKHGFSSYARKEK